MSEIFVQASDGRRNHFVPPDPRPKGDSWLRWKWRGALDRAAISTTARGGVRLARSQVTVPSQVVAVCTLGRVRNLYTNMDSYLVLDIGLTFAGLNTWQRASSSRAERAVIQSDQ